MDAYDFQARETPALITVLPVVVLGVAAVPGLSDLKLTGGGLAATIVLALRVLAGRIVRAAGRAKQEALCRAWDGMPTTAMLRHRDARLNRRTKLHYHDLLRKLGPTYPIPDETQEQHDPPAADEMFGAAMDEIRTRAKAAKVQSVYRENISYGFARNLYALKAFGTAVCLCCFLAILTLLVSGTGVLPIGVEVALAAVYTLAGLVWIFLVTSKMVKHHAEAYAVALFEAIEPMLVMPVSGQSTRR